MAATNPMHPTYQFRKAEYEEAFTLLMRKIDRAEDGDRRVFEVAADALLNAAVALAQPTGGEPWRR